VAKAKRRVARGAGKPRRKKPAKKPSRRRKARLNMAPELAGELWDWLGPEATAKVKADYALARPFEALAQGDWRALSEAGVTKHYLSASRATLKRHCVETLGRGYVKVALDFRMEEARRLLTTGNEPVWVVAYALGYPDATVFRHAFRRRFGVAPRQAAQLAPIPGLPAASPGPPTDRGPGRLPPARP
jgi:hypothetical protein